MIAEKDTEINVIKIELDSLHVDAKKKGGDDSQKKLDGYNDELFKIKQKIFKLKADQSKRERGPGMEIELDID